MARRNNTIWSPPAVVSLATAALALLCSSLFERWAAATGPTAAWLVAQCGQNPAFLFWDVGMKRGDGSLPGILPYA
jgi:hypothetical protein